MAKGDLCKVIIRDDFKNVLVVQKRAKKGEKSNDKWSLVSKSAKGRESQEKCVHRAVKEDLKTILFDLEKVKEVNIEENLLIVYSGTIKERIGCNENIEKLQWINKNSLENLEIEEIDKNILKEIL